MGFWDWLVILIYALVVFAVGLRAARGVESEDDFFLASRQQGWFSVASSTWATKLSALTFIGVPGAAMSGNFAYLQLWFGSFLASYIVAVAFVPEFYRVRVSTVYEYLSARTGSASRYAGAAIFIVSRCLASAVRLAGCAIAVSVFFGLSLNSAIFLIAVLAVVYVLVGGLRAVIWTDMLQLALFLSGAVVTIVFVCASLPGGVEQLIATGDAHAKFDVFDFTFSLSDATTFWLGNLFAVVLGVATGAADQDIAQRALACPSVKQAKTALIVSGVADLVSTFLFLSVGVAVFSYYQVFPDAGAKALMLGQRFDHVFPHFIATELPIGLRGLLVAALFAAAMSSLDSALSGLASSAYFDLKLGQRLKAVPFEVLSKYLVILFAGVLAAIAMMFGTQPSILWFGLQIMGYTYGGLLGLFVMALLLNRYVEDLSAAIGAVSSIFVVIVATRGGLIGLPEVPWPWAVMIGLLWSCLMGVGLTKVRSLR